MITLYRGIVQGRQRQLKTAGTGIWFSTSLDVAKTYSDIVEVWHLDDNMDLHAVQINCDGKTWNEVHTDDLARKYADQDIVIFKDVADVGGNYLKCLPDEIKTSKITPREAIVKCFTADDWVVNNTECIKKIKTLNFKDNGAEEIFERIFTAAEKSRII